MTQSGLLAPAAQAFGPAAVQGLAVPSTQEVLARALARSMQRGRRVGRWRTARRWGVYHLWRHGLPLALTLSASSSQLGWLAPMTPAPQVQVEGLPTAAPVPGQESVLVLRSSVVLTPVPVAAASGTTLPLGDAPQDMPEPLLKPDTSLHSQEP